SGWSAHSSAASMMRFASAVFIARRILERLGLGGLGPQPDALISAMLPRVARIAISATCSPCGAAPDTTGDDDRRVAAALEFLARLASTYDRSGSRKLRGRRSTPGSGRGPVMPLEAGRQRPGFGSEQEGVRESDGCGGRI